VRHGSCSGTLTCNSCCCVDLTGVTPRRVGCLAGWRLLAMPGALQCRPERCGQREQAAWLHVLVSHLGAVSLHHCTAGTWPPSAAGPSGTPRAMCGPQASWPVTY
jgi:hypothetical protein